MIIKKAIEDELERRGWSRYRLTKELEGKMPARTVYAYLSGERDLSSERVSKILKALDLKIRR
jgi:ribosome-binding protein aMBF1 (putative translation factor)